MTVDMPIGMIRIAMVECIVEVDIGDIITQVIEMDVSILKNSKFIPLLTSRYKKFCCYERKISLYAI